MADKCPALKITLKGDPKDVIEAAKKEARSKDITISGDATKGTMKHNKVGISGTYTVKGQDITIQMIDDTWLADCKKINAGVKEWFKGK